MKKNLHELSAIERSQVTDDLLLPAAEFLALLLAAVLLLGMIFGLGFTSPFDRLVRPAHGAIDRHRLRGCPHAQPPLRESGSKLTLQALTLQASDPPSLTLQA